MNSFPYESWEEALAELGPYFTFADSAGIVKLITWIGIVLSLYWMYSFISVENRHLNDKASELAQKYRS